MKYFIGYLIGGDAKKYHEDLVDQISEKFGTRNLNEYIPVHFTLKSPFETEDIGPVESLLEKFCEEERSSGIWLGDVDGFDKKIIYLNGEFSSEAMGTFKRLLKKLGGIEGIRFKEYEPKTDNFHSTLARAEDPKQFDQIVEFLSDRVSRYELDFDNIAILSRGEKKWEIYRKFELQTL